VTDENIVLDGYAFADKCVAGNLAVFADPGTFLYLYKCTDFGVVVNFASVKIHKFVYIDVFTELYVGGYFFHFLSYWLSQSSQRSQRILFLA
jgi:hypothetical protein